jgi:1,2-diacylglycerol 3-alpha-glucosyltransferase
MNIGFVSTWFERGAAYVTKAYLETLSEKNNVFLYARGGETTGKGSPLWDKDYVTWGFRLSGTKVNWKHFKKWIIRNNMDLIFFNEQTDLTLLAMTSQTFPSIKLGSYIDYYTTGMLESFNLFDFVICNTQRHYSVFKNHPQCFYLPWGTDTELYKQSTTKSIDNPVFFHSAGMSMRKGTDILIDVFISKMLYTRSKLIIHTQIPISKFHIANEKKLARYNIEVIEKTVAAPGLYHLGDIYVYPTTLEGIGLTIFEALSCGLPVITTDAPPMNEIVNNGIGRLIQVEKYVSREDGYYWPLALISKDSLYESMKFYIDHTDEIASQRENAREFAVNHLKWENNRTQIHEIFESAKSLPKNQELTVRILRTEKRRRLTNLINAIIEILPPRIEEYLNVKIKKIR